MLVCGSSIQKVRSPTSVKNDNQHNAAGEPPLLPLPQLTPLLGSCSQLLNRTHPPHVPLTRLQPYC